MVVVGSEAANDVVLVLNGVLLKFRLCEYSLSMLSINQGNI